ncbi:MAG: SoxR reducing system RseC family protein [Gammaproteobacteria bacterium]|nr:SoxR reducing system RseC family protein [Gammaproteobacteria bacterium]MBQ0774528.1 SoxR reducing system RseC family protein [Gammaproteobacteria bacterium]
MIEETGRVVAVEDDAVWVETVRVTACQSCAASKGCGHAVIDKNKAGSRARVRAINTLPLSVDQSVVLGLPEGALIKGAAMVYLMPLVLLFIGALLGDMVGPNGSAAGGVIGLVFGFLLNRWYSQQHKQDPTLQPRVLRVL